MSQVRSALDTLKPCVRKCGQEVERLSSENTPMEQVMIMMVMVLVMVVVVMMMVEMVVVVVKVMMTMMIVMGWSTLTLFDQGVGGTDLPPSSLIEENLFFKQLYVSAQNN